MTLPLDLNLLQKLLVGQTTYLPGTDITNMNGTNEPSMNWALRLDIDQVSLLFINIWINNFTAPDPWKAYQCIGLPKSFLNGATKFTPIPDRLQYDNGGLVNWSLNADGQMFAYARSTAIGSHVGVGFTGAFLLTK